MRNPLYHMVMVAMLLTAAAGRSQAQSVGAPLQRVAYSIAGITEQERDAIAQELASTGEGRVAYACVPAGILVLELAADQRDRAETTLRRHIGARTSLVDVRSQEDLEAACMNERNR